MLQTRLHNKNICQNDAMNGCSATPRVRRVLYFIFISEYTGPMWQAEVKTENEVGSCGCQILCIPSEELLRSIDILDGYCSSQLTLIDLN